MIKHAWFLGILILFCSIVHAARPLAVDDLYRVRRIADPSVSPDGKSVAFTVTTCDLDANANRTDIWVASLEDGSLRQLTSGPASDGHAAWSPDGNWIAFVSTRSADSQIWLIHPNGGDATQFTRISTGASTPVWAPDGKNLAFVSAVYAEFSAKPYSESNEENRKKLEEQRKNPVHARIVTGLLYRHWDSWVNGLRQHIFVQPVDGGDPKDITPGDVDGVPTATTFSEAAEFAFSPDGTEIVHTVPPMKDPATNTNHDIFIVTVATGQSMQITRNPAADNDPVYSPDGKWIAFRAQQQPGNEADRWRIQLYDRVTGTTHSITESFDESPEDIHWSPDSKRIYFAAHDKGNAPIFSVSISGDEVKKVVEQNSNSSVSVTSNGKTLVFLQETAVRPAEVYKSNSDGSHVSAVTKINNDMFAGLEIPVPDSIWYEGAGGTQVQAWLYRPPTFNSVRKYPFVLLVHGGPHSAWNNSWSYRWNPALWAAQGYVVLAPNPRGSIGFGSKFSQDIAHDWGGKPYEDVMKGVDYASRLPYVDNTKMAAAGASYGGYMINWIEGHSNRFKTLVSHDGIYNFDSMYGTTEEVWFDEWEHGKPWENREEFQKFSPHLAAANFQTPMLIIHSELDYRVPISEGMQMFTALQRKGIASKWLSFSDEGHWVLKPADSRFWHQTVFDWLAQYLK